jgi:hypothetical protein
VNCPPFPISLSFWVELVGACNSILTNYATKSTQTLWHPLTCKLIPAIKITGTENKIILLGDKMLKIRKTFL